VDMNRFRYQRGSAIGTTLVLATIALVVGLIMAATSFSHLNLATHQTSSAKALQAADSVIAVITNRILVSNGEFGKPAVPGYEDWHEVVLDETTVGRLTFSPATADSLPYSTNRFAEGGGSGYGDRVVPSNFVHLIGIGSCNGVERRVEVLLQIPDLPFALGSSGPIHSSGNLMVGSLADGADPQLSNNDDELLPAHVRSNSTDEDGVSLGDNTLVTGNVESSGGVVLDEGTSVLGLVQQMVDPSELPSPDLDALDPGTGEDVTQFSGSTSEFEMYGHNRSTGNLTVENDVTLYDALLYVEGDLHIQGAISGKGIIVAEGGVIIDDGAELDANNQAVLLAGGDVELHGTGPYSSAFQGLVYTEGDFSAEQISVVGALVGNSPEGEGSQLNIEDSRLVGLEDYGNITLDPAITKTGPSKKWISVGTVTLISLEVRSYSNGEIDPATATYSLEPLESYPGPGTFPMEVVGFEAFRTQVGVIASYYNDTYPPYPPDDPPDPMPTPPPPTFEERVLAELEPPPNPFPDPGEDSDGWVNPGGGPNPPPPTVFELSEFWSLEDRVRVAMRREI
jgi:hypothetical protein